MLDIDYGPVWKTGPVPELWAGNARLRMFSEETIARQICNRGTYFTK